MSDLAKDYICPACAQETANPALSAAGDDEVCEPCAIESWIKKAQDLHGKNERLATERDRYRKTLEWIRGRESGVWGVEADKGLHPERYEK